MTLDTQVKFSQEFLITFGFCLHVTFVWFHFSRVHLDEEMESTPRFEVKSAHEAPSVVPDSHFRQLTTTWSSKARNTDTFADAHTHAAYLQTDNEAK